MEVAIKGYEKMPKIQRKAGPLGQKAGLKGPLEIKTQRVRRVLVYSLVVVTYTYVKFLNAALALHGDVDCISVIHYHCIEAGRPHICHFFSTRFFSAKILLHTNLEQKRHKFR